MAQPTKPAAKGAGKPASKGAKKGRWNLYPKEGDKVTRKNKSCPKCGQGTFMAKHKDRDYCGFCHMTEFTKK